jgi:mannose-1-phosphate guanylyltransferase
MHPIVSQPSASSTEVVLSEKYGKNVDDTEFRKNMLHVIILAGGLGTRLWPASRIAKPKHMLVFEAQQTLLQATLERLTGFIAPEQTWIVASQSLAGQIADSLPRFDTKHFLLETTPRNTAPSIGFAAVKLRQIDPDATMIVLPADQIIKSASAFCETLHHAAEIVEKSPEKLVTIGIKPTFPATSYGYIQRGDVFDTSKAAYHVRRFCEKPNRDIAETFYQSGEFCWNAGIFIWKAETILKLLRQFEPEISTGLDKIADAIGTPEESLVTEKTFQEMKSISIDYAVMERATEIIVLESAFDWNDVGTWTALDRLYADQRDEQGNLAVSSNVLAIDSTGCTVRCDDSEHLIALVGLQDVVVIQTADATLIARKDQEESVRRIAEELKKRSDGQWS